MGNAQNRHHRISRSLFGNSPFRYLRQIERLLALAQGKGYGTATISQEVNLLLQCLDDREPALAIDIGGNVGDYTAELRSRHPQLEIHVFEPSTLNAAKLTQRFSGHERIHIVPMAVSDISGPAQLYADRPGSGMASLTRRRLDHFQLTFDVVETVTSMRFEDYWRNQLGERRIDLIKIDIEGHELKALAGMGAAIAATGVIQFEFGGCNIDTRTYFQDFWYFFQEHAFDLFRITPLGGEYLPTYRESDEFFATTNYLAVRRDQP